MSYVYVIELVNTQVMINIPLVSQVWEHRLVMLFCKTVQQQASPLGGHTLATATDRVPGGGDLCMTRLQAVTHQASKETLTHHHLISQAIASALHSMAGVSLLQLHLWT